MKNPFGDVQYENKPSGVFIVDGQEVAHTLQCCHCAKHFVSVKGSGKRRGYCTQCKHITCGHPGCDRCVPYEEKLLLIEGKKLGTSKYSDTVKRLENQFPGVVYF